MKSATCHEPRIHLLSVLAVTGYVASAVALELAVLGWVSLLGIYLAKHGKTAAQP